MDSKKSDSEPNATLATRFAAPTKGWGHSCPQQSPAVNARSVVRNPCSIALLTTDFISLP